jgi:hypothetical protein
MDASRSILTSTSLPPTRRADAGSVRLGGRDVAGLILVGDTYGAPYDLPAPRGAVLYRPCSGRGLEEISLDLMAYLELKSEGDNSMPENRQHTPRRLGWRAGGSA